MHFGTPYSIHLLITFGFLFILGFYLKRRTEKRVRARLAESRLLEKLTQNINWPMRRLQKLCYILFIIFGMVAIARPQFGERKELSQRRGIDLAIVADVSLSMTTEDISPSRFDRMRMDISRLIQMRSSDRIAIVPFSGQAHLFCPMTADLGAAQLFLDELYLGMIQESGTSISKGIEIGRKAFVADETKHKTMILFTDGETVHDSERSAALKAAEEAAENGIRIYAIGVGTGSGKPIPLKASDGTVQDFKKDKNGKVVISRLDSALLNQIAQKTGGHYFELNSRFASLLNQELNSLEKKTFEDRLSHSLIERYQLFLLAAFIFYVLFLIIPERKRIRHAHG